MTWGLVGDMGIEVMGVGVGSGTHFPVEHLGQWGFPEVGVQLGLHTLLQMGNLDCSGCLIGKWKSDPISRTRLKGSSSEGWVFGWEWGAVVWGENFGIFDRKMISM